MVGYHLRFNAPLGSYIDFNYGGLSGNIRAFFPPDTYAYGVFDSKFNTYVSRDDELVGDQLGRAPDSPDYGLPVIQPIISVPKQPLLPLPGWELPGNFLSPIITIPDIIEPITGRILIPGRTITPVPETPGAQTPGWELPDPFLKPVEPKIDILPIIVLAAALMVIKK